MGNSYSLIVGLGVTGLSCARYLKRIGKNFKMIDNRAEPPSLAAFVAEFSEQQLHLGHFDAEIFLHADEIILSPGLSVKEPAVFAAAQAGIPVIGDIELFARAAKHPIIAITGSNAKGTVTTLVGNMLSAVGKKVAVGGNIGTGALDLLSQDDVDIYVLELSSFQLETTHSLRCHAATILNISEDHLDRYDSMQAYAEAKQRIYQHCQFAIYNADDPATFPKKQNLKKITFGLAENCDFNLFYQDGVPYLRQGEQKLLKAHDLTIKGKHNWLNALAALALVSTLKLPLEKMLGALQQFAGLPHRCQWVATQNAITWIDDSKGTNVGATIAALEGLAETIPGKLILIAGGLGKGADFHPLRNYVQKSVRQLILLGQDAPLLAEALQDCCPMTRVASLQEAVALAPSFAQAGDVILLSPACSSLDMFKDYHHRGEIFQQCVRQLIKEGQ